MAYDLIEFGEEGTVVNGVYQYNGNGLWAIMNVESELEAIIDLVLSSYMEINIGNEIPSLESIIDDVVIVYLECCYNRAAFDFMGDSEWDDDEFRDQVITDYVCEADGEGLYDAFINLIEDQLAYLNLTYTKEDEANSDKPLIINDAQLPLLSSTFERGLELYGR